MGSRDLGKLKKGREMRAAPWGVESEQSALRVESLLSSFELRSCLVDILV